MTYFATCSPPAFQPPRQACTPDTNLARPKSPNLPSKTYTFASAHHHSRIQKNGRKEGGSNILPINRSLFTGLRFFPSTFLGISVHISFTFSNTMLQCLLKAFMCARSLRLLRYEVRTWLWMCIAARRIERGLVENSHFSSSAISFLHK